MSEFLTVITICALILCVFLSTMFLHFISSELHQIQDELNILNKQLYAFKEKYWRKQEANK
jgi:hypothetical protein